ncbi:MAG: HAMP domain-containing sensor histidine kinase [Mariprofundaceae bacterium]|nr:HAMP domain-containing sensor histidine kinase [Mariprofundaceae bacterium]
MKIFRGLSGTLVLWLLAVFAFVAFVGWHQLRDISTIHEMAAEIEKSNHQSHHLHGLEMRIKDMVAHAHEYLITGSDAYIRYYRNNAATLEDLLAGSKLQPTDEAQVRDFLEQMHRIANKIFSLPFATGNMEGPILMQELDGLLQKLSQSISVRHHRMDDAVNQSMRMVSGMHLDMREDFLVSLMLLFALLAGMSTYLYSRVVRPLILLRREVARIGEGDFSPQCPDFGENEIGDLSSALNTMGNALQTRDKELIQAKSFAAHQEKMHALGLMTASIAHEVGNPLSAAQVSVDVAKRKLKQGDYPAAEKFLFSAQQELKRTDSIISNVLDYGRQSSGEHEIINVEAVVASAVELVRLSRSAREVEFNVEFLPDIPAARGSEDMLRQVMVNLLLNALDACNSGGIVTIAGRCNGKILCLDVIDQGEGIPAEVRENIFSPMFTTKERGKGTGLGLSISRDLMRRMSGDLALVENGERGCRFRLTLPLMRG